MKEAIVIFVGGGIGAAGRYWLSGAVHRAGGGGSFPAGTLAVNILGCFLIGVLMVAMEERFLVSPALRLFLTIGVLGGFTTFSSFSYESLALVRDGEVLLGLLNVGGSVVLCLLATYAGTAIAKLF
jgi:CrcB protein